MRLCFNVVHGNYLMFFMFEYFPFIFFALDPVMNLNTAFYSKGALIINKSKILRQYIKEYLILDFVTLVPIVSTIIFEGEYLWIKSLFLLRIIKLRMLVKKMEEYLKLSEFNLYIFDLFKLFFLILYIAHVAGCAYHLMGINEIAKGNRSWIHNHQILDEDWVGRYINSLFYSVLTMCTVGFFQTETPTENFVSTFIILGLCGVFAYSVNVVGSIFMELNKGGIELRFIFI